MYMYICINLYAFPLCVCVLQQSDQISGASYCLPLYVHCNDVYDCPRHEDEHLCEDRPCPGLYRCRSTHICVHVTHVCDGWSQCPQQDDENFCNLTCPTKCVCQGHSYLCRRNSSLLYHPQLRFLHASGSGIQLGDLASNTMLIHLNLARCQMTQVGHIVLLNLRNLDLSFNHFKFLDLDDLKSFPKLTSLSLSGNPIVSLFSPAEYPENSTFQTLLNLDLSFVEIKVLDTSLLRPFQNLQFLNLSHCQTHKVKGQGFQPVRSLQTLDVRKCPLTDIPKTVFLGLGSLRHVLADNYKVCCPAALPEGFVADRCVAPSDEISSCDALLRSNLYRFSLAVFAALAMAGNILSLVLRTFVLKGKQHSGYTVFVTHLCASDFLMGLYLAIIGMADRIYLNTYLWDDTGWKNSVVCKIAGFLSLLSSEVSASIICLVTVDRFLVVQFPFSRLRFQWRSAQFGCLVLWTMGIVLAAVPLLPGKSSWNFYSQSGICIPLPVTRQEFPGHDYAFSVMIVFNFVLFLLIAAGQLVVYMAVRSQSMPENNEGDRRSNDLAVARRLFTVVLSDFLCWFPIGVLGLLAARDTPISGEVNVGMAIFVLPLNSALNPFLYSFNTIQAQKARAREQRLLRTLLAESMADK